MEPDKTQYRTIDFSIESCPPSWCPINKITPHNEDCCHGCGYFGEEEFYEKVFCEHPDANEEITLKIKMKK